METRFENQPQARNPHNDSDIFEPFPAPRVWYLGWAGEEWTGAAHQKDTSDFMIAPTQKAENMITIIRHEAVE